MKGGIKERGEGFNEKGAPSKKGGSARNRRSFYEISTECSETREKSIVSTVVVREKALDPHHFGATPTQGERRDSKRRKGSEKAKGYAESGI